MSVFWVLKCDECGAIKELPQGAARPAAWLGLENLVFCGWPCVAQFAAGVVTEMAARDEAAQEAVG